MVLHGFQICASDQPPSTPSTPERKRSLSHLSFGDRRVPPRPSEQVRAAARPDDHNPLTDCASPSNSFRNELKMDTPLTRMRPPKTRVRDPRSPGRARTTGRKLNGKVNPLIVGVARPTTVMEEPFPWTRYPESDGTLLTPAWLCHPMRKAWLLETATNGGREPIRFQRCYSWLRNFTLSYFAAGTM